MNLKTEKQKSQMGFAYFVVDAFVNASKRYSGNPAAVVILKSDKDIADDEKQAIAAEFNLAETAFVSALPADTTGGDRFLIRWFSPTEEVQLCGHATLASAFALATQPNLYSGTVKPNEPIRFRTRFGSSLQATIDIADQSGTLNFPNHAPVPVKFAWLDAVKRGIAGSKANEWFIGEPQFSDNSNGNIFLILRLRDDVDIKEVKPNYTQLLHTEAGNLMAVLVTKKNDYKTSGKHFESRAFGPWVGIDEDSVTGSSFTALTPYWDKVYKQQYGQTVDTFYAFQASKRTGLVKSELTAGGSRVLIGGQVRLFAKGHFNPDRDVDDELDKLHI